MTKFPPFARRKSSLIALACVGVLSAPMAVNAQTVYNYQDRDICGYGTCNLGFSGQGLTIQFSVATGLQRSKTDGATAGDASNSNTSPRNAVWTGLSWVRFSGSRLIGGNFIKSTSFAVESGITMDSGSSSTSAGVLGTRDTAVGIDTSIGSFWAGKWTTPYNSSTTTLNVTSSSVGAGITYSGVMGSPGFGAGTSYNGNGNTGFGSSATAATAISNSMSFGRTTPNTVHYLTPTFSGVQAHIGYTAAEETPAGANPLTKPELWSGTLTYKNGPLYIGGAFEQHTDYLWGTAMGANQFGAGSASVGAGTSSKDKGYKLLGSYTFGSTFVSAIWERLKYTQSGNATGLSAMQRSAWYLGVKQQLGGPHAVAASYIRAGSYSCTSASAASCDTSESGTVLWTLNYTYAVDKYTRLVASYGRMSNDRRGSYNAGGVSYLASGATVNTAGNTQTSYSVGISSSF